MVAEQCKNTRIQGGKNVISVTFTMAWLLCQVIWLEYFTNFWDIPKLQSLEGDLCIAEMPCSAPADDWKKD